MKQTTKGPGTMKLLLAVTAALIFTAPTPAQAHTHCRKHHGHKRCAQIHVARHLGSRKAKPVVPTTPAPYAVNGGEVENTSPVPSRFQAFGNTTIGDCTFAAAANYEIAVGDPAPAEAQIVAEFHAAGGSDTDGLKVETWASYWKGNGIGGIKMATTAHSATYARTMSQPAIANMQLHEGEGFDGSVVGSSGYHMVLMLSSNEAGVTVVTAGDEYVMPWSQWEADAQTVYTMVPA